MAKRNLYNLKLSSVFGCAFNASSFWKEKQWSYIWFQHKWISGGEKNTGMKEQNWK